MAQGPVGSGAGQFEPRRVTFKWQTRGTVMQTGFYLRRLAAIAATDEDFAEHVQTNLLAPFRALLSNTTTVLSIDVLNIVSKQGHFIGLTNVLGTWETAAGPTLLSTVLSFKSAQRTRHGQGRMFLPVASTAGVNLDNVFGNAQTAVTGFRTALQNNYVDPTGVGDFSLINTHPLLPANRPNEGGTPLPEIPATWYDVTSIRENPIITAVHSRKSGVGS